MKNKSLWEHRLRIAPMFIVAMILLSITACTAQSFAYGIAVAGDSTNVYRNPAENSRVLTKIPKGELYVVIAKEGNFYMVFALDNTIGYVPAKKVGIRWNDGKAVGVIIDTNGYTSMRTGPSTNYPEKVRIDEDVMFVLIGEDSWCRVLTKNGQEGYVLSGKVVKVWPLEKHLTPP